MGPQVEQKFTPDPAATLREGMKEGEREGGIECATPSKPPWENS